MKRRMRQPFKIQYQLEDMKYKLKCKHLKPSKRMIFFLYWTIFFCWNLEKRKSSQFLSKESFRREINWILTCKSSEASSWIQYWAFILPVGAEYFSRNILLKGSSSWPLNFWEKWLISSISYGPEGAREVADLWRDMVDMATECCVIYDVQTYMAAESTEGARLSSPGRKIEEKVKMIKIIIKRSE